MNTRSRIYLDHAATSWPKSAAVIDAMHDYVQGCGAAAGRGAYHAAAEAEGMVATVRRAVAALVHAADNGCISFHSNGTTALNAAIHGLLRAGDHVVASAAEHNSVLRPLHDLREQQKIQLTIVPVDRQGVVDAANLLAAVTSATKLVALTHASNVTGAIQPVEAVAEGMRHCSGKLLVDAAQTFGIPYPLFVFLAAAILAAVFLNLTIWGRYMLALGSNEEAARYSGIRTERVTILAYVICTISAATGGILFALDSGSISPSSFGNFYELYAIAAAVLGGCSLRGGEGSIFGVIAGTAVMMLLNNLILLLKIPDRLEFTIIGLVILLGVTLDETVRRIAARRRAMKSAQS